MFLHRLPHSAAQTFSVITKVAFSTSTTTPSQSSIQPASPPPQQTISKQASETFTLANNHTIGFSTCGPLDAPALFYFHGQSSSRLQGLTFARDAHKVGVRIICPDRPGIGVSTFDAGRRLLDYPAQIAQLARGLGLETFRVMGGSGGGPYVLACAQALPKTQLKGAAILAGLGPPDDPSFSNMRLGTRMLFASLRYTPRLVGLIADLTIGRQARHTDPSILTKKLERQKKYIHAMLTPNERKLFEQQPEIMHEIVEDLREHFRQGSQGFVRDGQLCVLPWGFRLEDVPFEGVRLYYGSEDRNTPVQMGKKMAERLRRAVFDEFEGETHMTLLENHGEEILRDIMEH